MYLARTVPPTGQVISIEEARQQLRITFNDEDVLLAGYIAAAVEDLEGMPQPDGSIHGGYLGRALLTQTFEYRIDDFPRFPDPQRRAPQGGGPAINLPMPPLQSVESIKYLDSNGALQTLDPSAYIVETALIQGRIVLPQGRWWPADVAQQPGAVRITFVAGYGDTAEAVPHKIRLAIKMLVGMYYNNRDASDQKGGFGFALDSLLYRSRITFL
jgi:uncharacterized phiE125 gp8 family phage protein